jgi:hypothetical protein
VESTPIVHDDLTNDPILESLSQEPMEYTACLSAEVVTSLQSVKHICLNVLDLLLLQMVQDLSPQKQHRRLSVDMGENFLLGSITQNTNLLQSTGMIRSKSSPPATSISDVYRILDNNNVVSNSSTDYTLCCSLAALLNDVYRLLELTSSQPASETVEPRGDDVTELQQQLHDKVSHFQQKRAAGIMKMESDTSTEVMIIWDEMDHLMNIVVSGLSAIKQSQQQQQQQPPAYIDNTPPPAYNHNEKETSFVLVEDKKKTTTDTNDLDELLFAIDRLSNIAPRLNNQRAELTERQVKELAAATLGKTVERLSRGRMEDQRAHKGGVLRDLVQQIHTSASRSLDSQRVHLNKQQQRNLDFASIHGVLDRMDKRRYTNQV